VHAALQDVLLGIQRSPLGGPPTTGTSPSPHHPQQQPAANGGSLRALSSSGSTDPSGAHAPPPADVDAFLADLERQIVAEMLGELEQLEAFEAAALAAAVAEREAFVAGGCMCFSGQGGRGGGWWI